MFRLRNWCFALIAGVIVVGCGGGGSGEVLPPPSTTGDGFPTVVLGNAADVQIVYLSGQGRRAPGSQYAVIDEIRVQNSDSQFIPVQATDSSVRVQLDGYTVNTYNFTRTFPPNVAFETYSQFPFAVSRVDQEGQGGNTTTIFSGPTFRVQPPFDLNFRIFPGRQTSVTININDETLQATPGSINFDRALFEEENYNSIENQILSYISDYVAFDISNLPASARPNVSFTGAPAQMLLVSGDTFIVSSGFGTQGSMELYDQSGFPSWPGIINEPVILGGTSSQGTYTLLENDPRDLNQIDKIAALQGIWRPHTQVLNNLNSTNMVIFPDSRGSARTDFVIWSQNGAGQITALWKGTAEFTGATSGIMQNVVNIKQLETGSAENAASGTLTVDPSNSKRGTFNFTSTPAGFPFPNTGNFVVFAR